jgi:hypothetical protein
MNYRVAGVVARLGYPMERVAASASMLASLGSVIRALRY